MMDKTYCSLDRIIHIHVAHQGPFYEELAHSIDRGELLVVQ
jgi:hypothetical protein